MGYKFQRGAVTEFYCPGVADFETYLKLIGKDSLTTFDLDEFNTTYLGNTTGLEAQYSNYYAGSPGAYGGILYNGYSGSATAGYMSLRYNINNVDQSDLRLVLPGTTPHFQKLLKRINGDVGRGWVEIIRNPTSLIIQPNTYSTSRYAPLSISTTTLSPSDFGDGVIPLFIWCGFTAAGGGGSASGCNSSGIAGAHITSGAGGGAGASGYGIINLAQYADSNGVAKIYCYLGYGGAGGSATASGQSGYGSPGTRLSICSTTPSETGNIVEAKGGYGGMGTTVGTGGNNTITSFDATCYYTTASELGTIHNAAVSDNWALDGTSWIGGSGGAAGENGNGPGNQARGDGRQFIIRTTPFCWPPASNNTNTWHHFPNQGGGTGQDGGGGGSSWFGVGGTGGAKGNGAGGGPGAGGGGGGFKTGTWNSGGTGGDGQIELYY